MHLLVLAADYDGTLASDGKVDASTIDALERVRSSGRKLILVTGRHLPDLCKIFPNLELFDRVIVENGGVLYRPADTRAEAFDRASRRAFRLAPAAEAGSFFHGTNDCGHLAPS